MKNKHKLIIALILLSLLGLAYWYIARPYIERKNCSNEALDYSLIQGITGFKGTEEGRLASIERKKLYDAAYEYCLHSKGL